MSASARSAALTGASAVVLALTGIAWVLPREAASAAGHWALPGLAAAALLLALALARDWRWLGGLVAVFVLTVIAAWLPESETSTAHFAGIALGLLVMMTIARVVDSALRLRLAVLAFLAAGLLVLVVGFRTTSADELVPSSPVYNPSPTLSDLVVAGGAPPVVNPNALSAAALLIAPLGLAALWLRSRDQVERLALQPLGAAVLATGLVIVVASRSRSTALALWVLLVASLVKGPRSLVWRGLAGSVLAAAPFAAVVGVHSFDKDAFTQEAIDVWATVSKRADIWAQGRDAFEASPWLGIGLNQFRHIYTVERRFQPYDVAHAHNVFLQTALDVGLIGLAAYLGMFACLMIYTRQAARGPAGLARNVALGGALSWVAISLFGLTDAVSLGAKIGVFQWLAGGLILAAWRLQGRPAPVTA